MGCVYPFLRWSGPVETPTTPCSPQTTDGYSIHFCEEVAQLKRLMFPIKFKFITPAIHFCEEVAQLKPTDIPRKPLAFLPPIHFCEEVAQLKRQYRLVIKVYTFTTYPFLRRSGPIETGAVQTLGGTGVPNYPFLRRSGPIETRYRGRIASIYFRLSISAKKWPNWNLANSKTNGLFLILLSISAKKWPNWNALSPTAQSPAAIFYPFLRRSGPIETFLSGHWARFCFRFYPFLRRSGPIETLRWRDGHL